MTRRRASKRTERETLAPSDIEAESRANPLASPSLWLGFRFPAWSSPGLRRLFALLSALVLIVAFGAPPLVHRAIRARQRALPENAAARVIEALDAGDDARARRELARWESDGPAQGANGIEVLRFGLVPEPAFAASDLALARRLALRGWKAESRAACWRAIRRIHVFSRGVEDLEPWDLLASLSADEPMRFEAVARVIAAHGVVPLRRAVEAVPGQSGEAVNGVVDAARARLAIQGLLAPGDEPSGASWSASTSPSLRLWRDAAVIEEALSRGARGEATRVARELDRAFPGQIEVAALLARAERGVPLVEFLDSTASALGGEVVDFRGCEPVSTMFVDRRGVRQLPDDSVVLPWSGSVELPVRLPNPVARIVLTASGSAVLGIPPIVLVSVDGGEAFPVAVDSESPALFSVPFPLAAGAHRFRFEYLNDFQMMLGGVVHDRNLVLSRMLFVPAAGR